MPSKSNKSSADRPVKPEAVRVGRFLEQSIEQTGLNIYQFAEKAGFSPSTVYQLVDAKAVISRPTAKKFAAAFAKLGGPKVTAEEILSMIDDDQAEVKPREKVELLPISTILWHLRQHTLSDRIQFWSESLKIAAEDFSRLEADTFTDIKAVSFPIRPNPGIDMLIMMINAAAVKNGLPDSDRFLEWMMDDKIDPEGMIAQAFQDLLLLRKLPAPGSKEYGSLLSSLARALDAPSSTALIQYCNLAASDQEIKSTDRTQA